MYMNFTTEYMFARRKELMDKEDNDDLVSEFDDDSNDNDEIEAEQQDGLLPEGKKNRRSKRPISLNNLSNSEGSERE